MPPSLTRHVYWRVCDDLHHVVLEPDRSHRLQVLLHGLPHQLGVEAARDHPNAHEGGQERGGGQGDPLRGEGGEPDQSCQGEGHLREGQEGQEADEGEEEGEGEAVLLGRVGHHAGVGVGGQSGKKDDEDVRREFLRYCTCKRKATCSHS